MHHFDSDNDSSMEVSAFLSKLPRKAGLDFPLEEQEDLLASLRQQALPLKSGLELPKEKEDLLLQSLKAIPRSKQRGLLRGLWIPLAAAASIALAVWIGPFASEGDSSEVASLESVQFDPESLHLLLEERNDYELLFEEDNTLNLESIDEVSLLAYILENEEEFNDHWYELEIE